MTTRRAVEDFLSEKRLAIAGASRNGKGFGNTILKELRARGYEMAPVHPEAEEIQGVRCARSVAEVAGAVGGLVLVVPPSSTEQLVQEACDAGIRRVWIQQGAESPAAIEFCEQNAVDVIHGECILMFAEPVQHIHRFHRWIAGLFGKLPD